jgi:hypothetical protein
MAIIVSQLPLFDTSWPQKNSRKLRVRRDRKVPSKNRFVVPASRLVS